jgi:hypothetical protein
MIWMQTVVSLFSGGFVVNLENFRSKPLIILLVSVLLIASLLAYVSLQWNVSESRLADQKLSQALAVSIEPKGPVQLNVNQVQVFTANTSTVNMPLNYSWMIENSSADKSAINGTDFLLLTCGNQAVFKFLDDQIEFCWLSGISMSGVSSDKATVTIQCIAQQPKTTSQQSTSSPNSQQTQTQNQNYYTTNIYNNSVSTASYIVKPDGTGQYQVINGTDGNIITDYTSNSADITLNKAIANGGTIAIRSGDYSGAQLNIPPNAIIIAEPTVTGIKYASIADGARIDEPAFNTAFGSYISADYTITTNTTSLATINTQFLAFKPDRSIYGATTDFSALFNKLTALNPSSIQIAPMKTLLTAPLIFGTGLTISGAGCTQTIFQSNFGQFIFQPATALGNCRVQITDVGLILPDLAGSGGIDFTGVTLSIIQNVAIQGDTTLTTKKGTGIQLADPNKAGNYFNEIRSFDIRYIQTGIKFANNAWVPNENNVIGGRLQGCDTGILFEGGTANLITNTDFEGNHIAINCSKTHGNSLSVGFFELNTIDIQIDYNGAFSAQGTRRDINVQGEGIFQFLGSDYGDNTGILAGYPTGSNLRLISSQTGITASPGNIHSDIPSAGTKFDFTFYQPKQVRLVLWATATTSTPHNIRIYMPTLGAELANISWTDSAYYITSSWVNIPSGLKDVFLDAQWSSVPGDTMTIYVLEVQFR